jgi:hypothetical protein
VTPLNPRRTINGREGRVFTEGNIFLPWVESVEARIVIDRADVVLSGRHVTGYKATGCNGNGTINGFHVTSKFRAMVADYMRTGIMPEPTYIVIELADPEMFRVGLNGTEGDVSFERAKLSYVSFWEAPIGYDTGDLVRDDIPFTFEDIEFEQTIAPAGINF